VDESGHSRLRDLSAGRRLDTHARNYHYFALNKLPNATSMSRMDESKFSELLIFFIANYFLTFLIIGLAAAVLSLINKPKPLRINVVAEALFSY
jgi:hypothetical protein